MHFHVIPAALLSITSFFFLFKINFLHCVLSYGFTNLFHATFMSMYIMLIFYVFRWRYCRHEKTNWNMLTDFCCRWIFRIIFTSITFFYYRFKSCINDKWCFIRSLILIKFLYILVPSEGIITLYKSLISHTFLCDSSLIFGLKEWR